jgi:hypothetical protein
MKKSDGILSDWKKNNQMDTRGASEGNGCNAYGPTITERHKIVGIFTKIPTIHENHLFRISWKPLIPSLWFRSSSPSPKKIQTKKSSRRSIRRKVEHRHALHVQHLRRTISGFVS